MTRIRLVGREDEVGAVDAFLELARTAPTVLALVGPAGIGKTSVWTEGVRQAEACGFRVVDCRPAAVEAALDFAGLTDLLADVDDAALLRLPDAQARALTVALRRAAPGPLAPDSLAIGLATHGILSLLAGERPVLVAIDDAQWLDPASARALTFALRRIRDRPVSLLTTERTDAGTSASAASALAGATVATRVIGPLGVDGLEDLLREHLGVGFLRPTLLRIEAASGGNPFYALEIGRGLLRRGIRFAPDVLPIPATLTAVVRERLEALPPEASAAALLTAVLSAPTARGIRSAASSIEPGDGLGAAEAAGVLEEAAGTVRFTHPLLASVAYDAAPLERRRAIHRAAARVTSDPEERARHLALAAEKPSERIARTAEDAAGRARSRGSSESAATLAQLAYRLTPDPLSDDARRRAISAAEHFIRAGDPIAAIELLEGVSARPGPARAELLVALADAHSNGDWEERLLVLEAAAAEAGESPARIEAERLLAGAGMVMDRDLPGAVAHGLTAVRLAERSGDPAQIARTLALLCRVQASRDGTVDRAALDRAVELGSGSEFVHVIVRPEFAVAQLVPGRAGDLAEQIRQVETLQIEARRIGDWDALLQIVPLAARLALQSGDWPRALELATEAEQLSHQIGQPGLRAVVLNAYASVLAHLGRSTDATAVLTEAEVQGEICRGTCNVRDSAMIRGFLELSGGDSAAAHAVMEPSVARYIREGSHDPERLREIGDDVEALCRIGRVEDAERVLEPYERRARAVGSPNVRALADRSRALILAERGDTATALGILRRIATEAFHDEPFQRGRTLLVLGEVARRDRKIGEARRAFTLAAQQFEHLGAALWAAKARREEARLAGRHPGGGLTETDREITRLVAAGRTNREIADALFMSSHTVDSHLRRIFLALDVHSRTELVARLGPGGWEGTLAADAGR